MRHCKPCRVLWPLPARRQKAIALVRGILLMPVFPNDPPASHEARCGTGDVLVVRANSDGPAKDGDAQKEEREHKERNPIEPRHERDHRFSLLSLDARDLGIGERLPELPV